MADPAGLRVLCYAGHRAEQTPKQFFLGERAVDVVDVLDSWIAPDHRYFKCRGSDGDVYILRHDVAGDRWELTMFARGSLRDGAERVGFREAGRAMRGEEEA